MCRMGNEEPLSRAHCTTPNHQQMPKSTNVNKTKLNGTFTLQKS